MNSSKTPLRFRVPPMSARQQPDVTFIEFSDLYNCPFCRQRRGDGPLLEYRRAGCGYVTGSIPQSSASPPWKATRIALAFRGYIGDAPLPLFPLALYARRRRPNGQRALDCRSMGASARRRTCAPSNIVRFRRRSPWRCGRRDRRPQPSISTATPSFVRPVPGCMTGPLVFGGQASGVDRRTCGREPVRRIRRSHTSGKTRTSGFPDGSSGVAERSYTRQANVFGEDDV